MPGPQRTGMPAAEQDRTPSVVDQDGHGRDGRRGDAISTVTNTREFGPSTEQQVASNERLEVEEVRRTRSANPATWIVPIFFGVIWAIDAWFKWLPDFQHNFMKIVQAGAASQPSWLGPWYQFWQTVLQPYAHSLAVFSAIIETVIAVALIVGFARKPLYIFGALWSFGIWAIPEGFGNTSRAAYTDIGTSIIYVTVFAALWALDSCTGPRRYSLDALIERRFPRWKRIAEVRDS